MLHTLTLTHSDILEINSTNLPRVNVIATFINRSDYLDDDFKLNNYDSYYYDDDSSY